jgi:hypothetical protein
MDNKPELAYLLLYCANIDTQISLDEVENIKMLIADDNTYDEIRATFENDDELTRLQKVEATIKAFKTSLGGQAELLNEIKALFSADADFSASERFLLRMIGRD